MPPGLDLLSGVHDVMVTNHRVSAQVDPAGLGPFLQALTSAGLHALTSQPPTLEDLFLRHYGSGNTADAGAAPGPGAGGVASVPRRSGDA